MSEKFRPYQREIDDSIYNELSKENKCIVKAFCGTGKSNIMAYGKAFQNHNLKVYVFPSLSLIDQFNIDYLNKCKDVLPISSESTTDPKIINTFMKKKSNKIICITYNSFHLLNDYKINMCVFDEAHHAIGETYQELIFNNTNIEKCCFFTATPKTANGIDMLKDCGKVVYDYPYLRGVAEGYLNPFEIRIDLFGENTNNTIYDSIARAYYKTGNTRILTFHSDVNTDSPTSVRNFVNEKEIINAFKKVVKEFPNIDVPTITMLGFYSELKLKERRDILKEFDTSKNVFILSSCETMGEGIDTKNANMCVFVDPKTSFVKIIQNIGRVVRKQFNVDKPHSTILLPIYINKTKYEECKSAEECDAVIREEMKKGDDFTPILNVMSALKQEDEDLYDICLYYPNNYSPKELEHNFKAQGYKIGEEQELEEIFDDDLEEVAERDNIQIDIHTDSLEEPIITYGVSERVVSILQTEDKYCKIDGEERAIKSPKRIRLDVHTNMDIQVLWKIENIDLGSCLLECEVNTKKDWIERLEELKNLLEKEKRKPNIKIKSEKSLYIWLSRQHQEYKENYFKYNPQRCKQWEEFSENYKEYISSIDELWNDTLNELKQFMIKEKRRPSKEKELEKYLGYWITNQLIKYKTTNFKNNSKKCKQFETFIEEYKDYFKTDDEKWNDNLQILIQFIIKKKRRPNEEIKIENKLARWTCGQNKLYKLNQGGFKNNPERCKQWYDFMEKYKEYFKTLDKLWGNTLNELKIFLDKEKRKPNIKKEKILYNWLSRQIMNYKKDRFKDNPERCKQWEEFSEIYKEYTHSIDELWNINLNELKIFLDKEKRILNIKKESEKYLCKWLSHQLSNYKTKTKSFKDNSERCKQWEEFLEEYKEYLTPKKSMTLKTTKEPKESTEQKRQRIKKEISELHQKYKTLTSANLSKLFEDKTKWEHYHTISERNEESFPKESIPRNKIITELDKIKTKRPKKIVDMGCGKANISKHFKEDKRFEFTNYDHVSNNASVEVCDISHIPLEDDSVEICILSLAMWGSNCKEYIQQAHRVLETNGTLYIIEPTKRWTNDQPADRLRELLTGFKIIKETVEKFTMFIAIKI
jgi:superfamily II DNA or RNA helicase/ubiquinone/menaquinone biosynthesis C-methylase UbiE